MNCYTLSKMKLAIYVVFMSMISCIYSKDNMRSLTESLGQEVIEIGVPAKALPADLEEEPSAELDEEEKMTSTTLTAATKRDAKKTPSSSESSRRKGKELAKSEERRDDEEAKIEKELAEIYKDNIDYKADSSEVTKEASSPNDTSEVVKPLLRSGSDFKFQPDRGNKAEVERFRTSVDVISCDKRVTKLIGTEKPRPKSAARLATSLVLGAVVPLTVLYM